MLFQGNTQAQQQLAGAGFGGVAVHLGELGFQLGHGHAVFFAHFRQRVDAVAFGLDLPQLLVAHDHGVEHGEFFVGELVLAQFTQAHIRLQHDLAAGRVEVATEDFHEGRLAATVGTDQTIAVAGAELDRDVLEERLGAELHGDVSCGDQLLYLSMGCERDGRCLQACVNSDIKARNPVAEHKIGDVCWNLARIVAYVRRQLYGERRMVLPMSQA